MATHSDFTSGYADIDGLSMYYEVHGRNGVPLALIHGGGSTLDSTFGRILPKLAERRRVIAMELQAHGRTGDRPGELSFERDADDVASLLGKLGIAKADILGFSNGGHTAIEIALRHPGLVRKLILASAFYKRDAAPKAFWQGFDHVTLEHMPKVLRDAFLAVNPDPAALRNMFDKDVRKMKPFRGWSDEQMRSIRGPVLVINGNRDVGSLEHAVAMCRVLPHSELAVFPGGHGTYLGSLDALENGVWPRFNATELIEEFLTRD